MKEQTIEALMVFITAVQMGLFATGLTKGQHFVEYQILDKACNDLLNALGEENITREEP